MANIEDLRFPTGIGRITRGECPIGAFSPMGCMLCEYGHMLECHHPMNCEEAKCSHYRSAMEAEAEMYPEEEKPL